MIIVIAASRLLSEGSLMNERTNTIDQRENEYESTYALLIHSEEESRNVFEMVIYPLLILGPIIAVWQFTQQPVNIPATGLKGAGCVAFEVSARTTSRSEFDTLLGDRLAEIKG